jgi:Tfp pilus assembly protein PilW
VKTLSVKERFLGEERGFSLPEMLTTILIMIVVFFALHSIFTMSLRVYSFGNDKAEASENARLGLERMEREIRQASLYDMPDPDPDYLFPEGGFASDSITFGNDLNGDGTIDTATEEITYSLGAGTPATLLRNNEPMIEFVQDADEPADGEALTFEYMDEAGNPVTDDGDPLTDEEAAIQMVRIRLEVAVDRGIQEQPVTQVLTTEVDLRNRSG